MSSINLRAEKQWLIVSDQPEHKGRLWAYKVHSFDQMKEGPRSLKRSCMYEFVAQMNKRRSSPCTQAYVKTEHVKRRNVGSCVEIMAAARNAADHHCFLLALLLLSGAVVLSSGADTRHPDPEARPGGTSRLFASHEGSSGA